LTVSAGGSTAGISGQFLRNADPLFHHLTTYEFSSTCLGCPAAITTGTTIDDNGGRLAGLSYRMTNQAGATILIAHAAKDIGSDVR